MFINKIYIICAGMFILLLTISCTDPEFDNPFDERNAALSSSSGGQSSSSGGESSSSGGESSSSSEKSSSSAVPKENCEDFVEDTERMHYGKLKKQFCDKRDNQKYVYVTIGEGDKAQTWMAENLNYSGDTGEKNTVGKCGDDENTLVSTNTSYCNTYGRLYSWVEAMGGIPDGYVNHKFGTVSCGDYCFNPDILPRQGICPEGWHIPTNGEWDILLENTVPTCTDHKAGCENAGTKLKATSNWSVNIGMDEYDFSALPGGHGTDNNVNLTEVSTRGWWWSVTEYLEYMAFRFAIMENNYGYNTHYNKNVGMSIRCVKDEEE